MFSLWIYNILYRKELMKLMQNPNVKKLGPNLEIEDKISQNIQFD